MCKHVAAVLHGIGARLDSAPDLLFRLRAVDENDLLGQLDAAALPSATGPAADRILEAGDVSALFGIEMADDEQPPAVQEPTPKPARSRRKPAGPAPEPVAGAAEGRCRTDTRRVCEVVEVIASGFAAGTATQGAFRIQSRAPSPPIAAPGQPALGCVAVGPFGPSPGRRNST